MGEVISRKRLEEGRFPHRNGSSQIMAGTAIRRVVRNYNEGGGFSRQRLTPPDLIALHELFGGTQEIVPYSRNFELSFQGYGSTFTGRAGRRGDLDMAIGWARLKNGQYVRSHSNDEVIEQDLFVRSLKKRVRDIAARFHVHPEAHFMSMVDTRERTSDFSVDPLFLDHVARASLHWRIGDPLQELRNQAINIEEPLSPLQEDKIAAIALEYTAIKAEDFASALQWLEEVGDDTFEFEEWREGIIRDNGGETDGLPKNTEELQCETLQRAVEFAKAIVRKMIAVAAVEGRQEVGADVTSRADMYRRFHALATSVDKSGDMNRNHRRLIQLDAEYDELLEYTIDEKAFSQYEKWIQKKLMEAVEIAYQLAAQCHKYIEEVIDRKEIVIAEFPGYYDDAYRLVSLNDRGISGPIMSSSARLSGARQL